MPICLHFKVKTNPLIYPKLVKNAVILILSLLVLSLSVSAQSYAVEPLSVFLQSYKEKLRIAMNAIEPRMDLTVSQKMLLYEAEVSKIKSAFRVARKEEYQSKAVELSVAKKCESSSSGGKKDCGVACVSAPAEYLYTRRDWIRVDGTNKGVTVTPDGSIACLHMTVAGRGLNEGTLYAVYRYKPGSILTLVENDVANLFIQLAN